MDSDSNGKRKRKSSSSDIPKWLQDSDFYSNSMQIGQNLDTGDVNPLYIRKHPNVSSLNDFVDVMRCIDFWGVHEWTTGFPQIWNYVARNVAAVKKWRDNNGSQIALHVNFCDEMLDSLSSGCNIMFTAAKLASEAWLSVGFRFGINVNIQDENGFSCLHHACAHGHLSIMQILIKRGANIELTANDNSCYYNSTVKRPAHVAAQHGHLEAVRMLHKFGADVKGPDSSCYETTPLEYAATNSHVDVVRWLAKQGACVTKIEPDGYSIIGRAVMHGNVTMVSTLLDVGAGEGGDFNGDCILNIAIQRDQIEIVKFLVNWGSSLIPSDEARRPFQIGNLPMVKALVELGIPLNSRFECSVLGKTVTLTMVEFTVAFNQLDVVRYLHSLGTVYFDNVLLHCSAYFGHDDMVHLLIELGMDVNCMMVSDWGNLIGHYGAEVITVSALHIAAGREKTLVVKCLLDNGVNVNCHASNGNSALHFAVAFWSGHFYCSSWSEYDWAVGEGILRLLIDAGADVRHHNTRLVTAFDLLMESLHREPRRVIKDLGVDYDFSAAKRPRSDSEDSIF